MTTPAPPAPGEVLQLGEDDYKFGVGTLTLRVSAALRVERHADGLWLAVRGVEIRWDGTDGKTRDVLVRMTALSRP